MGAKTRGCIRGSYDLKNGKPVMGGGWLQMHEDGALWDILPMCNNRFYVFLQSTTGTDYERSMHIGTLLLHQVRGRRRGEQAVIMWPPCIVIFSPISPHATRVCWA